MGYKSPLLKLSLLSLAVSFAVTAEEATTAVADDLEVIVVSGTKTAKPLKDVAGSISVMTSEDMDKLVGSDMNQLFKYDPSVRVTGDVGNAQNFVVRGMGGDRVLMIKDGMRMNEGYGANGLNDIVGRGFIDTDTVKQVEVAKGAASSLYGSDALGGIVVFVTKDASDYLADGEDFAGNVKLGYSDVSKQSNFSGTFATITGEVEHLLSASYRDGEEQQNYDESKKPFDVSSHSVLYKAKWNISDKSSLTFSADLYKQDKKGSTADGLLQYFRSLAQFGYHITTEQTDSEKDNKAFKLSFTTENETALYDYLNVNLYKNTSEKSDVEYGQIDINAPMFGTVELRDMWKTGIYEQDTIGLLTHATKKLNNQHTLGFGLDIEQTESSRIVNENREVQGVAKTGYPKVTNKFPTTDVNRLGVFINDEISLMDGQLTVTPGVRFDQFDMDPNGALNTKGEAFQKIDKNHTSFNLGALYNVNELVSAYFQYGQGFKVPAYDLAYIEHYNNFGSYVYEIVPSEDLSPEESDTYEIGLKGYTSAAKDMSFNAAVFYNKYDNFLQTKLLSSVPNFNDDGSLAFVHDTFQYQNIDAVTIKGAEAGFTYYPTDNLSVYMNASYQDGKDDNTGEYISSISPLSGTFGVSYQTDNWYSDINSRWSRSMSKVNEGDAKTAGSVVVDWLLGYDFNEQFTIRMAVNNLLDKRYVDHNKVAGHGSDEDLSFFTEAGRNINVSVSYNF